MLTSTEKGGGWDPKTYIIKYGWSLMAHIHIWKFTYGGTALYFFGDSTGFFSVSESLLLSSELDLGLNSAFLGTGAEGFTVAASLTFFSDSESLLSSELESSFLVGGLKIGGVKYNLSFFRNYFRIFMKRL